VPVKLTECGLPTALLDIEMLPVLLPSAVGVNVTLIEQLAPAKRVVPQVVMLAKSPLALMLAIFNTPAPLFVTVTAWGELVLPMF
jgi:hypothetical protein